MICWIARDAILSSVIVFAGCLATASLVTEPDVSAEAASSVATVAEDVVAASPSMPTVADASDETVEASDAELSSSPSYPEHVKQA